MKMTKTVTTNYHVVWFKRDEMTYSERYIRARKNQSPLDKCFDCNKKFKIGEKISLVNFKGHTNKVFCGKCLESLSGEIPASQLFYHVNNHTGEKRNAETNQGNKNV